MKISLKIIFIFRILSKAFGGSHSPHSADISGSPDGRRRSRTASLGSGSALQNLQKRLSSSSFISRRSVYQHHPTNIISTHHRSGAATMSNNTYCECPSNMMMMMCPTSVPGGTVVVADGSVVGGNNMNISGTLTTSTTSLSPCVTAMNINPSAPTASTLSISGGNVYAELDPVSIQQQLHNHHHQHPPLPACPPPGEHVHLVGAGMVPMGIISSVVGSATSPLTLIGNTPGSNQYVVNHRRRQAAPLPPIPIHTANQQQQHIHDQSTNPINCNDIVNVNGSPVNVMQSSQDKNLVGLNNHGPIVTNVLPTVVGDAVNQMEMNDLNDIYYSDLDCKQIQF